MMNKLKLYIIKGIFFVLFTGTLAHFVYEWSGNNPVIGLFVPVNESTWEHMKLCFFPMVIYSFYMERNVRQSYPCVTSSLLLGILLSTFLIPVIFYTYSGILGYNLLALDIATFAISVILSFFAIYRLSLSCKAEPFKSFLILCTVIMVICFLVFTYNPPDINIFANPIK